MKRKIKIILCIAVILTIIAGTVMVVFKGFNFELKDQDTRSVELYIKQKFNIDDMRQITNEVFGDSPVLIQKVEVYEENVLIIAKEIKKKKKDSLISKVNEKYGSEIKTEDITVQNIPHMKLYDMVKPYIKIV